MEKLLLDCTVYVIGISHNPWRPKAKLHDDRTQRSTAFAKPAYYLHSFRFLGCRVCLKASHYLQFTYVSIGLTYVFNIFNTIIPIVLYILLPKEGIWMFFEVINTWRTVLDHWCQGGVIVPHHWCRFQELCPIVVSVGEIVLFISGRKSAPKAR